MKGLVGARGFEPPTPLIKSQAALPTELCTLPSDRDRTARTMWANRSAAWRTVRHRRALDRRNPPPEKPKAARMNDVACDAHPRLRPLALPALFALDIKPRGMVLDPIIPEKGLVMLYAARGTGKTHVALGIAYAVATGGSFLKWQAPKPRRVLLVDGEMPAAALRERLQGLAAGGRASARLARSAGRRSHRGRHRQSRRARGAGRGRGAASTASIF